MINRNDEKQLKQLKEQYDLCLKENFIKTINEKLNFEGKCLFQEKYPVYFKKEYMDILLSDMDSNTLRAYKEGAGEELESKGSIPPKMLSIGSSSLFCFKALSVNKNTKANEGIYFFTKNDKIDSIEFEKPLPIIDNVIPPHMDAYSISQTEECFFECKCHEMFDKHRIILRKDYFNKGLIVDQIPNEFIKDLGSVYEVSPKAFGLEENSWFDVKQLLTHLMGVSLNRKRKKTKLIYYYEVPLHVNFNEFYEMRNALYKEIRQLFLCSELITKFVKNENIKLEFYVYINSGFIEKANKNNTKNILARNADYKR